MASSRILEKSDKKCLYTAIPRPDAVKAFESAAVSVLIELDSPSYLWLDSN